MCGCWAAFVFTPASETRGWCCFRYVAMLDVFPLSFDFLVPQRRHTVTVLSTNLFSPYRGLRWRGAFNRSSARHDHAVTEHAYNFFFFHKSIRGSRAEDIDPNGSRINGDPLQRYHCHSNGLMTLPGDSSHSSSTCTPMTPVVVSWRLWLRT